MGRTNVDLVEPPVLAYVGCYMQQSHGAIGGSDWILDAQGKEE